MTRSFVIDTDTASDDAVALLLAAADPHVELRAITLVAGNVPIEYVARNAVVTLDTAKEFDVPVFVGHDRPLARDLETAQDVHGDDGMSGASLPVASRRPNEGDAVEALVTLANAEPGRHTLVTLGPLTNIAAALAADPEFLTRFEHTYMMAGSPDGVGNVNTAGEYNVWADPEAATAVLAAPGDKTMIGWNISRLFAVVRPEDDAHLRMCGRVGRFVSDINVSVAEYCREESGFEGYDLPDPVAMAVALDDAIITEATDERMVVGLDEPTRGAVLLDRRANALAPNCRVVWAVDAAAFKRRLFSACETLSQR